MAQKLLSGGRVVEDGDLGLHGGCHSLSLPLCQELQHSSSAKGLSVCLHTALLDAV